MRSAKLTQIVGALFHLPDLRMRNAIDVNEWNLNLDDSIGRSGAHLQVYLKNPNNGMEKDDPKRHLYDRIPLSAEFLGDRAIALAQLSHPIDFHRHLLFRRQIRLQLSGNLLADNLAILTKMFRERTHR